MNQVINHNASMMLERDFNKLQKFVMRLGMSISVLIPVLC